MPTLGPATTIIVQPPTAPATTVVPPRPPGTTVVAVQGPQGVPGSVGAVVYTQGSPASTWTINTGLGRNPYALMVVVGNTEVIGDVTFNGSGQIVVTFPSPATGSVSYL